MRIAVCIFGLSRFIHQGKSLMNEFYDGCEVDYYIHNWKDDIGNDGIVDLFNPVSIEIENPIDFSNHFDFPIDISKTNNSISNVISPLYSIYKVGNLLRNSKKIYDFVVFTRTDIVGIGSNLINHLNDVNVIYNSYVHGDTWNIHPNKDNHLDAKLMCSNTEHMLYFSELFINLEKYLKDDKKSLCHHRLWYHHMEKLNSRFQMINLNTSLRCGGWYLIRNNKLSES